MCAYDTTQVHFADMLTKVNHKRSYYTMAFFSFFGVCLLVLSRTGMETECRLVAGA